MKFIPHLLPWLFLNLFACSQTSEQPASTIPVTGKAEYAFEQDYEGWVVDFADYPVGSEKAYALSSSHAALSASTGSSSGAVLITGNNHSDDLFMFMKRPLSGLKPNTTYRLTFTVQLASKYPAQSLGIGGSPGTSVYLKAGASATEPQKVATSGQYRLNLDKGNQASDGKNALTLGTIGIDGSQEIYKLIERTDASTPFEVSTDANGSLWLFIGTDSGYEGTTTLYYDAVSVAWTEK